MPKLTFIGITALAAALLALAPTAFAKGGPGNGGVVKRGGCSSASVWKLKAKADNGRIETEFEVDQNRVNRRWRVTIVRNGVTVFSGIRRTVAPSGSFSVNRLIAGPTAGARIVAHARALVGSETCNASIAL